MRVVAEQEGGVGLAANQVGLEDRVCLVQLRPGEDLTALINPVIDKKSSERAVFNEGCLSFPNLFIPVLRYATVDIEYIDEAGHRQHDRLEALGSICFQHELDHLNGITFLDRLTTEQRKHALSVWDPKV